ncbi:MAG: hypothetical protein B193_3863 [Solidesulfovibrio magneticus str. Maddingley MBC34]|uniref:Uncharacterized protein n=1 Tax=Solidesulfovibrio magneticus str. Maddingley MBC34 TaxID=1206767 RepID=K6G8P4_9BACT|nr:MAG: hypothetical protein B193_3863 [Solidesulfovibrio magneticus str. Maddingley MBC34]
MSGQAMLSPPERRSPGRRRPRSGRRAVWWVACAAVAALVSAAGVLHAAYGDWVGTGPLATGQGNRVITALAMSPADPNVIYAGTGSATVFRSAQPTTRPTVSGLLLLLQ